jgi:hypothetical protein
MPDTTINDPIDLLRIVILPAGLLVLGVYLMVVPRRKNGTTFSTYLVPGSSVDQLIDAHKRELDGVEGHWIATTEELRNRLIAREKDLDDLNDRFRVVNGEQVKLVAIYDEMRRELVESRKRAERAEKRRATPRT